MWGSGSQPRWSEVAVRKAADWAPRLQHVPLPCNFAPSPDVDAEGVVIDQTGAPPFDYYEFWTMRWSWAGTGLPNGWSAGWAGAAKNAELASSEGLRIWPQAMGAQGSGIAFIPGLPRISELAAGRIGFEGVKPGQPDPYYRVGGYFGCDGLGRGQPANGNEYDCRPTTLGAFAGFPFDKLVEVN